MLAQSNMNKSIENKIKSVNWDKYSGPEYYAPNRLIESLISLSKFDESQAKNGLDNEVLFSVGNNHAGTYYPAILDAADLLIELERSSEIEATRKCAYVILNDLYYFGPELGSYDNHTYEQIESFVKKKLKYYADDET